MTGYRVQRAAYVCAFLLAVAAFSGVVWNSAHRDALNRLAVTGAADLALAANGVERELARYRSLSVLIADHPEVARVLDGSAAPGAAEDVLREIADKTGALDVMVIDSAGQERAKASRAAPERHTDKPYFQRAMDGALGLYHLASETYEHRAYILAAPVFAADGPVAGVVVVVANIETVEAEWRGGRPAMFFTDDLGVIFISNRSELILRSLTADPRAASRSAEYRAGTIAPFPAYRTREVRGHDVWLLDGGRYLPDEALHLTLDVPVVGLTGEILLDLAPVRQVALLQASVAGALCLAFGAMLFLATERRRTLAEANARLEARVAERTQELLAVNADLRHEIGERQAAETRLRQAQADLVQAGKLSALGQMSAGISHELNQPLMAIRSYAENAEAFLGRGDTGTAARNLGQISDLARRMGRIIRNLRAFARQDDAPLQRVNLGAAVDSAIEVAGPHLRETGVSLTWQAPDPAVWVRGGEVRLSQVVLNLIANAADAMAGGDDRRLTLSVRRTGDRVALVVRDTGPGLSDPERVFEPFYTTKQMPSKEGLGLGLSISYGLVQSFGGQIRGRNPEGGGAEFTVDLVAADAQEAAA